jgi:hypothetical protein
MTPRTAWWLRLGLLVVACILATLALGWPGPIFVGVVFAAIDGRDRTPSRAALAAAAAWSLMIATSVLTADARAAAMIGGAFGVATPVLALVAVAFATALAWSSATLAFAVRRMISDRRGVENPGVREAAAQ